MMRAEAEIFSEENLPLLAEEQKLVTAYNKLIGSLSMIWEGEERTLTQMFPLANEPDRSIRQPASEICHYKPRYYSHRCRVVSTTACCIIGLSAES